MTTAVCWKCGAFKFGAFMFCKICGATPESDDDLSISLVLTDHYFDEADLRRFSAKMKNGITAEVAEEMKIKLLEKKNNDSLAMIVAAPEQEIPQVKPWWKFWR